MIRLWNFRYSASAVIGISYWKQPLCFTYRSLRYLDDGHYEAMPKAGRSHPDAEEGTQEELKGRALVG